MYTTCIQLVYTLTQSTLEAAEVLAEIVSRPTLAQLTAEMPTHSYH